MCSGREYVVWNIRLGLEYVSSNYMSDMKFRFGSWIRLALILRSGLEYVLFNYRCYMISTYVSSIRLICSGMEYVMFNYIFDMHISFGSGILLYKPCVHVWSTSCLIKCLISVAQLCFEYVLYEVYVSI